MRQMPPASPWLPLRYDIESTCFLEHSDHATDAGHWAESQKAKDDFMLCSVSTSRLQPLAMCHVGHSSGTRDLERTSLESRSQTLLTICLGLPDAVARHERKAAQPVPTNCFLSVRKRRAHEWILVRFSDATALSAGSGCLLWPRG